jgi:VWFA-related protein
MLANMQTVWPVRVSRYALLASLAVSIFATDSINARQAAQTAERQEAGEPFRTEVNYIRVDLYPTLNGAPVADLNQTEIEVLEEGVPQQIVQFEQVLVRAARSQEVRRDPTTVREMREAVRDARARLFVLFLDTNHVEGGAAIQVAKALSSAMNELIGGDDLIAVMRPGMSARDLTFTRRTTTIEELLKSRWGGRDRLIFTDPVEEQYATCYPAMPRSPREGGGPASDRGIAQEMILRRREAQTLDAFEDLVRHLGALREERKAVITVTAGWRLYGDNPALRRPIDNPAPPGPAIGLDPRTGRLGTAPEIPTPGVATVSCERDRVALSMLQNESRFHRILDEANRANTSFYPLDPRGLVVFDENIVPLAGVGVGPATNPMVGLEEDRARLNARTTSLRVMAENTDGLAIVQTSEIAAGLRKMADDLSSYYLIGYYSTGKLDGRFHRITVRVKRPGVSVRARRGYLAGTAAEAARMRAAATARVPEKSAETRAVEAAVGSLAPFARPRPVRIQVASGWPAAGAGTIWAVAEIDPGAGRDEWRAGGDAEATLLDHSGAAIATEQIPLKPGVFAVRFALTPRPPVPALQPGEYQVQIRVKGSTVLSTATERVRVSLPPAPNGAGILFTRRGISTGNKEMPTADLRFRRTERLRLDVPAGSGDAADVYSARLLDRVGHPLSVPVTATLREDAEGSRWHTTEVALAPLAAGDYVIELTAGSERTLAAFRVLP